jgi:hypothetical protein
MNSNMQLHGLEDMQLFEPKNSSRLEDIATGIGAAIAIIPFAILAIGYGIYEGIKTPFHKPYNQ